MSYNGLTNQGLEYLTRCQVESKPVVFSKVKIGNGNIPMGSTGETTTDLYSFKKEIEILNKEQVENSIKMEILINNFDVLEEFYVKEIGVYVMDNDVEKLYWYINKDRPSPLPDKNTPAKHKYILHLETSQMESIILNYTGADLLVDKEFVEEKLNEVKDRTKALQFSDVESMKQKNLKVGDIVEVLGYYTAGDGAGHKRIIANEDDGSGVQLSNRLWANIVHNGEVNVSWFGAKGDGVTDDTLFIQKAIDTADIINFQEKTYLITVQEKVLSRPSEKSCLFLKNNLILNLNSATLKINNPENYTYTCLLRAGSVKNIKIYNGKLIGDRDTNPGSIPGQHGHGVRILEAQDIVISDMVIINMFGDGISIDSNYAVLKNYSSNITIKNCIIDNIRRNGITISTAENVTVDNNIISNVNGTAPEACIDIETNSKDYPARNIKFTNNTLSVTSKEKLGFCIGSYTENVIVSNNILEGGTLIHRSKDIVINDNIIKNGDTLAIRNSNNVNVESNIFNNVSLVSYDNVCQSIINNNIFNMIDRSAFGISQDSTSPIGISSVTITNNVINSKKGYLFYGYSILDSLILKNNYFNSDDISEKYSLLVRARNFVLDNNVFNFNKLSYLEFLHLINFSINNGFIKNNTFNVNTEKILEILFSLTSVEQNETNYINITNNTLSYNYDTTVFYLSSTSPKTSITYNDFRNSTKPTSRKAVDYEVGNRLKVNVQAQIQQLNSIYHLEKMKQENVYDDYISYMDEKTLYDKQQRNLEKERQLAYQEALKENPNLTYEEFMSVQPMILNLVEEPQPSKALKQFMEKYL